MNKLLNLKSTLITVFTLVVLLGTVQLVVANEMSSEGQEIRKLEERRSLLEDEIRALEKEVAALGSLVRIEEVAKDLGLGSNPQVFEYLSPPKLAQAP